MLQMDFSFFFSLEFLAIANVILSIITLTAFLYARRKFFPGLFKNLLDLLIIVVLFLAWEQLLKLFAAYSLTSYDLVFQIGVIHPMLINILLLIIAYRAVKMSEVYGFAENPIIKNPFAEKPAARASKRKVRTRG